MSNTGSSNTPKPPKDLLPAWEPHQVNWATDDKAEALGKFFALVSGQADEAIDWYYRSKRKKKWLGQTTRLLAIGLATLAGILPTVAQITAGGPWVVPPGWATVALALAAALVVLDRFYGYTSAWMRYLVTAQELKQALDEFRFDWEVERVRWRDGTPDDVQVVQALMRLKAFLTRVNLLVRQETKSWVDEFRTSLRAIEESARIRADVVTQGGANVILVEGDKAPAG